MDPNLQKALLDRVYEKRKSAALELEKQVREAHTKGDQARINVIIQQLCGLLASASPQNVNARNGGLIGLAGISIALGMNIAPYLEQIVPPVLACFTDPDSKIRYFACESFYNIAKVCKGEILIYFNEIFDALSKLAADSEVSVKNGAELLDRLLKDIVCETAPQYVSVYQDIPLIRARQDAAAGYSGGIAELDVAREKAHVRAGSHAREQQNTAANKTFSLARFVPLLAERMYVLSPFTRNYLVSWVAVLDSVPDLELVSFLPSFLDGLLKYLSDPNMDVRLATANVLAEFLREIREAAESAAVREQQEKQSRLVRPPSTATTSQDEGEQVADTVTIDNGAAAASQDGPALNASPVALEELRNEDGEEMWIAGREVRIGYADIMEVLINHITYPDEEIQATTLQWIAELLLVVKQVVIPFTPRLIPAILPNLAHHSPAIQKAAIVTNQNLMQVVEDLPAPASAVGRVPSDTSLPDTASPKAGKASAAASSKAPQSAPSPSASPKLQSSNLDPKPSALGEPPTPSDPFDYQVTVNMLALQLLDQHEETRVSSLQWLLMLHSKAPQKILTMEDGTFPALLKTLSDPAEEVIRHDLRLLAQISSASEDSYFSSFMANLLSLFSTDRRLLETRGSLIIRQLCASLHTERIFRTLSELLEKDEDLEFASIMVQNLNLILVTSPELADFRRRLKNMESKDGQQLFVTLYRSWCHNAVAAFTLCLLAQAYEQASNLLQIFAELEMTVAMLIQVDKLVQLLESPIFTSLRLQLLDPDKNPFLLKAMYGLLMLLPQSSAFATLRNRLSAVSNMGTGVRSTYAQTARSNMPRGDTIKWGELLAHFRNVQNRHERSRRVQAGASLDSLVPGMASTQIGRSSGSISTLPHSNRRSSAVMSSSTSTPRRRPTSSSTGPLMSATPPTTSRLADVPASPSASSSAGTLANASSLGLAGTSRPTSPPVSSRPKTAASLTSSRLGGARPTK
ncbi:unnamed protein product [Sympodiomycopsis kandeliae]